MAAPNIKSEPIDTPMPHIKPDPSGLPSLKSEFQDDDLYEDAGDLELSAGEKPVWLVKLPSFIAERWKDLGDDEEITLGVVKIPPHQSDDPSLKLVLEKNEANGLDTPSEYDMRITNLEVTNTYVFTEKDLPGFGEGRNQQNGAKEGQPAIPQRLINQRLNHEKKDWKNQKFKPYVRKPISKRTALVGTVRHEISMIPVNNPEYRLYQAHRTRLEEAPKHTTRRMEDNAITTNLLAPGTAGKGAIPFARFVKPTQPVRKPTDNKAHRMSESDLQSKLFECFQEHEYWTMKAFREKLVQPEAFLKQTLEDVAVMNKSGPFSGKWSLKPEYKRSLGAVQGGSGAGGAGEADDDDDEDEVEMEDVPLGNM